MSVLRSAARSLYIQRSSLTAPVLVSPQKEVVPFLTRAFMPIVETIFAGLRQPVDEDDELVRSLVTGRRAVLL